MTLQVYHFHYENINSCAFVWALGWFAQYNCAQFQFHWMHSQSYLIGLKFWIWRKCICWIFTSANVWVVSEYFHIFCIFENAGIDINWSVRFKYICFSTLPSSACSTFLSFQYWISLKRAFEYELNCIIELETLCSVTWIVWIQFISAIGR